MVLNCWSVSIRSLNGDIVTTSLRFDAIILAGMTDFGLRFRFVACPFLHTIGWTRDWGNRSVPACARIKRGGFRSSRNKAWSPDGSDNVNLRENCVERSGVKRVGVLEWGGGRCPGGDDERFSINSGRAILGPLE
jgi:hypothetical protein